MSKRQASEALGELAAPSPVSKRSRTEDPESPCIDGATQPAAAAAANGHPVDDDSGDDSGDDLEPPPSHPRRSAPATGYDDLYLDTISRSVLDFDFEKLCSVSLSNINVYACLVCGRYFQGRGTHSHAYLHSVDEDHHVFINLETQRVYILPDGYEVTSRSLDDIKYVSDPRYTRSQVRQLDRASQPSLTLDGRAYRPGFVGMNNIKANDYVNVAVQALAHVAPLRNYLLLEDLSARSELVRRCATLFRKVWNPRAFKSHVSPHELLQEVALLSNRRFTLTQQADPVDFLAWFLGSLHVGLGGSHARPGSSPVHAFFQGRLRVESQAISRRDVGDRLRFEEAAEVRVDVVRFLMLTLDLPPQPLFQDDREGSSIIPQVPLAQVLAKYDGVRAQEHHALRKRYRLLHPLPPFLLFHVKRFSQNKFVAERNPTIVTFDARNLDVAPYVEPDEKLWPRGEPIWYDLVANVVHEAVRNKEDVADSGEERKTWKVQIKDKATGEWVVAQDLFVDKVQSELLYLGETYLQIWERRAKPKSKAV